MGQQVVFFADDVDLHDFLVFAERSGFLALPDRIEGDEDPEGLPPTQYRKSEDSAFSRLHLLPTGVSPAEAFYDELADNQGVSILMKSISPVTEIRTGKRDGDRLFEGRIHFSMDRHVTHFEQGQKGYQRLARYMRRWQKTARYTFRVGPHTASEVAAGRLRLMHWNEELSIAQ